MHKDFVPPVSIEEFAAYLDGNLTEDGMNEIALLYSVRTYEFMKSRGSF